MRLLCSDTDAAVLVQAVDEVSLATRHQEQEWRGVALYVDHTHCLLYLYIHDDHLSQKNAYTPS